MGRLDLKDIHAHAFDRGDDRMAIAFWADEGKRKFKLRVKTGKAALVDLMGAERGIDAHEGILELEAGPSVKYLILPVNGLAGADLEPIKRNKPEIKPYDPTAVSPVVLRLQFPSESRDKKAETYLLKRDSATKVGVEVYNFGEADLSYSLKLRLPEGWSGALDDEGVSAEPMGQTVRELTISPTAEVGSEPVQIQVNAVDSSGETETFILAWIAVKTEK
jgi:hypothetical protein